MFAARWIAAAAFVVCVPVLLVLTNVRIAATEERVFDYGFSAYNVPAVTGLERAQMDAAAHEIVRYFTSGDSNSLLDIRVQTPTGSAQPLYSDREVIHMRDVKQLFQFFFEVTDVVARGHQWPVFAISTAPSLRGIPIRGVAPRSHTARYARLVTPCGWVATRRNPLYIWRGQATSRRPPSGQKARFTPA